MLTAAPGTRIFLATEPIDMRRGHDGLCAYVRGHFDLDPYSGAYFVFLGKRGDRAKVLFWDRGGFVVYYKRLAKGRFRWPRVTASASPVVLDATELAMLLGGFDLRQARRLPAWSPSERLAG